MNILSGITILLAYQLVGEVLVFFADLSIPGPVVGLLLLLVTLIVKGGVGESLEGVSKTLLTHLSLLFVPAGVGVMVHFQRIEAEWLSMGLALLLSTLLSLAFTALLLRLMVGFNARRRQGDG
ncbi:MAG: CidA/LrgA family protein [Chromatiales bacterium]|nr:CidA/LrgA family protein [Chromatiales bacterium]